jgi:hypothetical protein
MVPSIMKLDKLALIPLSMFALLSVSCYDFVSQTTVMNSAPTWTGASAYTLGSTTGSIGLAGQDIYWFNGTNTPVLLADDALLDEFGAPYVLTGVAQSHTAGFDQHTFIHGNLVGDTDNISLLYVSGSSPLSMDWVDAFDPTIVENTNLYEIVQICDIASAADGSYGEPHEPNSHMYMSFRACTAGSHCTGGVLEFAVNDGIYGPTWWWPKVIGSTEQVQIRRPNGSLYSNECMPIAVTTRGDQTDQYLVVGDPSADEFTVFDAFAIGSGPIANLVVAEPNRNIRDIVIEGRGDGSSDYGMFATLWTGSAGSKIEHRTVINGDLPNETAHLVEPMPSNITFLSTLNLGAEGTTGVLYTFGTEVKRRSYAQ